MQSFKLRSFDKKQVHAGHLSYGIITFFLQLSTSIKKIMKHLSKDIRCPYHNIRVVIISKSLESTLLNQLLKVILE